MKTAFLKKHRLETALIFILIVSLFVCIYRLSNYKSSITGITIGSRQNRNTQNGQVADNSSKSNSSSSNSGNNNNNMFRNNSGQQSMPQNSQNKQNRPSNFSNKNMQGNTGNFQNQGRNTFGATSSKYSFLLIIYFAAFLILAIVIYRFFKGNKIKINSRNKKLLIVLLIGIGFLARIALSTAMEGYSGDIRLFSQWASSAAKNFTQFYSNTSSSDYPPLYIYILSLIGKLTSISGLSSYSILLLKLPSLAADMVTAYLIYRIARKYISFESGLLLSAFYMFNPAIFIDSALWGQVDSFFTMLVVLSVFLICQKKTVFSSAVFTLAVLMKPQGIIFLPVLLFELIRNRSTKLFIKSIVSAVVTASIVILPFSVGQNILWIFKLYAKTISEYPYASINGFNFYSLIGANYTQSSNKLFIFSYSTWGIIAIAAITLFSFYIYIKNKNKVYAFAAALVQISGVFTFSTGMHERYLFPALALCILSYIYLKDKRFFILCIGYSITIYTNIYYVLFGHSGMMNSNSHSMVSDGTSLLNVILFIYLIKILIDITKNNRLLSQERIE